MTTTEATLQTTGEKIVGAGIAPRLAMVRRWIADLHKRSQWLSILVCTAYLRAMSNLPVVPVLGRGTVHCTVVQV